MTFSWKSYGEYTQVKKSLVVNTSYEGLDEEEEFEMVPIINDNNYINVVSDFNSDLREEDFKNNEDNFFEEDVNDQVKISPQTNVNAQVVWAMKKLQTLYNDDANKIAEQATNEKSAFENLNFLID